MPDQESTDGEGQNPDQEPSSESGAIKPAPEIPPLAEHPDSRQEQSATADLSKDIKREITLLEWIGIGAIAVNIVIAVIYYGQLTQMRKATEASTIAAKAASANAEIALWALAGSEETSAFTLQQMEVQSAAQKESADAAEGHLAIQQKVSRAFQRPYVWAKLLWDDYPIDNFHHGPFVEWGPPGFHQATVKVQIRNSGATPAIDVLVTDPHFIWDKTPEALKKAKEFASQKQASSSIESGFVLAPNDPQLLPMKNVIPIVEPDTFKELHWGQRTMYIVGVLQYRDIFKPSIPPYVTTYCFIYTPNTLVEFEHCPFGNSIE
jgi:hypothetical protein